jgi:predicted MFS family arabinose efflux permease
MTAGDVRLNQPKKGAVTAIQGTSSRQRWTLLLVCTAAFMLLLDITVVSVALPSIQRELHASLPDLQWVSAAYALMLAVLLLPAATLGDRLGRRRLFLVGLAIFTGGSLACALATTAMALEFFRALQGVGGAVLFATATPLLRAEFSGAALARALGVFGATLGGASAIGPLLYVQNTLRYSPVQGGLRLLPMFLASFTVALLTGRLLGKVQMRVLLAVAMAAAAAGLASMANLTATSTWLAFLPGFVLAGIGLGITSTGLASAALSAVEPARAGMAAGLTNTLRQVGTATGVAVFGALYASRVTTATLHQLAGVPASPATLHRLAAAVASGAGVRVAAVVPPTARIAVTHAAHAGTASGLNDVLLAAAAFAAFGAIVGFAYGPDPVRQPQPIPAPVDLSSRSAPLPQDA